MFCSSIPSEQRYKEMVKICNFLSLLILNDVYIGQAHCSSLKFSITSDFMVVTSSCCPLQHGQHEVAR